MSPEQRPVVPTTGTPPVPEQRRPEPVSQVDWFRSAPTGGTVFAPTED